MTVGMFLYAFGWIGCILPADGMGGGAAGLSLVLCMFVEHLFGWQVSIGTMVFMINALLLLVAFSLHVSPKHAAAFPPHYEIMFGGFPQLR